MSPFAKFLDLAQLTPAWRHPPGVPVVQKEKEFEVKADIPGVDKSEIKLTGEAEGSAVSTACCVHRSRGPRRFWSLHLTLSSLPPTPPHPLQLTRTCCASTWRRPRRRARRRSRRGASTTAGSAPPPLSAARCACPARPTSIRRVPRIVWHALLDLPDLPPWRRRTFATSGI